MSHRGKVYTVLGLAAFVFWATEAVLMYCWLVK